jgi:hypothetical protein
VATTFRTRKIVSREAVRGELTVLRLRCGGFAADVLKPIGAEKEPHLSVYHGAVNILALFETKPYCEGFLPLSRVKTLLEELSSQLGYAEQYDSWDDHCEWLDCLHEVLDHACASCVGDGYVVIGPTD